MLAEAEDSELHPLREAIYKLEDDCHEPGTKVAVCNDQLAKVMHRSTGTMDSNVGLVSYAKIIRINGKSLPHRVLQRKKEPITLLLPEEMIDAETTIGGKGVIGVILPMAVLHLFGSAMSRLPHWRNKSLN